VRFVVDIAALGQLFVRVIPFSPANYHSVSDPAVSVITLIFRGWYDRLILVRSTKGLDFSPFEALQISVVVKGFMNSSHPFDETSPSVGLKKRVEMSSLRFRTCRQLQLRRL